MKTTTKIVQTLIVSIMIPLMVSCGGFKVDTDVDEAVDKLGEIVDKVTDEAENVLGVDGDDDSETSGTETSGTEVGSETEEGIEVVSTPAVERSFMGTYAKTTAPNACEYYPNNYDTPAIIRGFSHTNADFVDFENNQQQLVWVARVFEDDTFDFSIQYAESIGDPTTLSCTCDLDESYFYYTPETIDCVCEDSDGSDCTLTYEKQGG